MCDVGVLYSIMRSRGVYRRVIFNNQVMLDVGVLASLMKSCAWDVGVLYLTMRACE